MARRRLGFWYRFAIAVVKPLLWVFTKRDWPPGRPFPEGGIVVVANHLSHVDPFVLGIYLYDSGRPPRFLAKASLFSTFFIGTIVRHGGQIPVYRETRDASVALRDAIAAVERGECVVVYPEGTLTRDPELWPMVGRTGAARIAFATGCPVIPVAMWGPQALLAPYSHRPHLWPRTVMHVRVGAPIVLTDVPIADPSQVTGENLRGATERIMDALTGLVAELRGESPPARRLDPKAEGLPPTGDPRRAREPSPEPEPRRLGSAEDDGRTL